MITSEQYLINKKRIKKGEEYLDQGDKWLDIKFTHWVKEYNKILEENLEYENFYKIGQVSLFEEKSNG